MYFMTEQVYPYKDLLNHKTYIFDIQFTLSAVLWL